jgi:hypothetical protein
METRANVIVGRLVVTSSCLTMCISSAGRNVKRKPCHGSSGLGRHGPAEISKKADRSRRQRLQLRKLFGNANSSITCCGLAKATAKNGIMFVRIPYEADLSLPPMIGLTQVRSNGSNSKRPSKNLRHKAVFRSIAFPKSASNNRRKVVAAAAGYGRM